MKNLLDFAGNLLDAISEMDSRQLAVTGFGMLLAFLYVEGKKPIEQEQTDTILITAPEEEDPESYPA